MCWPSTSDRHSTHWNLNGSLLSGRRWILGQFMKKEHCFEPAVLYIDLSSCTVLCKLSVVRFNHFENVQSCQLGWAVLNRGRFDYAHRGFFLLLWSDLVWYFNSGSSFILILFLSLQWRVKWPVHWGNKTPATQEDVQAHLHLYLEAANHTVLLMRAYGSL